eukprot:m.419655 g.419655  ORF g.419655 m.419655 type:complete len:63 (-) comp31695_c0_seq1:35-223(-)
MLPMVCNIQPDEWRSTIVQSTTALFGERGTGVTSGCTRPTVGYAVLFHETAVDRDTPIPHQL